MEPISKAWDVCMSWTPDQSLRSNETLIIEAYEPDTTLNGLLKTLVTNTFEVYDKSFIYMRNS
jgi:hypothetical protein